MAFTSSRWLPVAVVLAVLNVVLAGTMTGGAHAFTHAGLAAGFAIWAQRIRQRSRDNVTERAEDVAVVDDEVGELRRELSAMQERLDYAERLLAQRTDREARRER